MLAPNAETTACKKLCKLWFKFILRIGHCKKHRKNHPWGELLCHGFYMFKLFIIYCIIYQCLICFYHVQSCHLPTFFCQFAGPVPGTYCNLALATQPVPATWDGTCFHDENAMVAGDPKLRWLQQLPAGLSPKKTAVTKPGGEQERNHC